MKEGKILFFTGLLIGLSLSFLFLVIIATESDVKTTNLEKQIKDSEIKMKQQNEDYNKLLERVVKKEEETCDAQ